MAEIRSLSKKEDVRGRKAEIAKRKAAGDKSRAIEKLKNLTSNTFSPGGKAKKVADSLSKLFIKARGIKLRKKLIKENKASSRTDILKKKGLTAEQRAQSKSLTNTANKRIANEGKAIKKEVVEERDAISKLLKGAKNRKDILKKAKKDFKSRDIDKARNR
jgi:hypothetical protein